MTDVSANVISVLIIQAPVDRVAEFAADPSNAALWYTNISSVERLTPGPIRLGSRVVFVAHLLGRTLRYTYEIVEFIESARLVMRTTHGPFPMETSYTWEAVGDDRTRMTIRNHGEPAGFSKLLAPFIAPAMGRANRKHLAKLTAILEKN